MTARAVASLTWTAISGSTKLLIKLLWLKIWAKGQVKNGKKNFYKTLVSFGISKDIAKEISQAFADPALELLKMRIVIPRGKSA